MAERRRQSHLVSLRAVHAHLIACSSVLSLVAAGAAAQQAGPAPVAGEQQDEAMETIVVTGSNIAVDGFGAVMPLQVLGRSEIERFGALQVANLFKAVPSNTGSIGFSEADQLGGTAQFNLRGLGFGSTLTLVNGRRAGVSPIADSSGTDFVDLNQFPTIMIDRIEILKDGASAIYGSEAVAGVANVVTRGDFEGLEFQADYQNASNEAYSFQGAVGTRFERGHIAFFGGYYGQTRNIRTDFDWLDARINGDGDPFRSRLLSSSGSPGSYRPATIDAEGRIVGVDGSGRVADPDCLEAGGFFIRNDDGSINDGLCRHSFADQLSPVQEENRLQGFFEMGFELLEGVRFFNESNASRNVIKGTRGPSTFSQGLVAENATGNVFIPGDHPFNFFIQDPSEPTAIVYIGPDDWDNDVHAGVDLAAQMRPLGVQFNGRGVDNDRRREVNYFRIVNGLEVDLPRAWRARASYQFATGTVTQTEPFDYRADVFNQLVIDGLFNPFGTAIANPDLISPKDGVSTAGNAQTTIDQFSGVAVETTRTTQHVADVIVTGDIADFGTGPVGLAAGGQYREITLRNDPNPLTSAGEGRTIGLEFSQSGRQDVWAAFAETVIPFHDLATLQVAVRHEDYGGTIGSTTDPKISARLSPTDWISLRGSWGTAFQAPTVRQTSASRATTFFDDPTISGNGPNGAVCDPVGRNNGALVSVQGSDDLGPQSSDSYNVGVVVTPTRGLSLSVDYWAYDYTDLIAQSESAQAILDNDCADDGIPNDPRVIRDGGGQIIQINTEFVNIGQVETNGLDIAASYGLATRRLGDFLFGFQATYVNKFDVEDGETAFDGAGSRNFRNNFSPIPQWRFNASLGWVRGPHSVNATVRYIDGYDNDQSNDAPIDSFTTVDLQYGLNLAGLFGNTGTSLVVGADNIFDQDPPALARNTADGKRITGTRTDIDRPGYDPLGGADIRGRVLYVRVGQKF